MAGYNWDEGKSNNALQAENSGLILAGAAAKLFKCTAAFITQNAPSEEWHHVSGWFNRKHYYKLETVKLWWLNGGEKLWQAEQSQKVNIENKIVTLRFSEWINRKTCLYFECRAKILKQGASLAEFTILSDVNLMHKSKKGVFTVENITFDYQKGQTLKKKIQVIENK